MYIDDYINKWYGVCEHCRRIEHLNELTDIGINKKFLEEGEYTMYLCEGCLRIYQNY